MFRINVSLAGGLCFLLLATQSSAALVEGVFSGTITVSNDQTNYFGLGFGNVLSGQTITGSFRYNTDNAGPDGYPLNDTYGTTGYYFGNQADWIDVTINVAGGTEYLHDAGTGNSIWDSVITSSYFDYTNALYVLDLTQNPASSVNDDFDLLVRDGCNGCTYNGPDQLSIIWGETFTLNISEFIDDSMIVGDGAAQTFVWTDDPASPDSADGSFVVNHQVRGLNEFGSYALLLNEQYSMSFDIDSVSASVVPVPAAVWLFGSALAGLACLRRKQII